MPTSQRTIALLVAIVTTVVPASGLVATATAPEEEVNRAAQEAEVAARLVDAAVAERDAIELALAASITQLNDLTAELSRVSAGVDQLQGQIGYADTELGTIETALAEHAVRAYMDAVSLPSISVITAGDFELALVGSSTLSDLILVGSQQIDSLVIKKRALESLRADYLAAQQRVAELRLAVDGEVENLAALYEQAEVDVATAIRTASAADAAYRAALDELEAARAREAERRRQQERAAQDSTTTTTVETISSGEWTFPEAVERWRDLVTQYFPSPRVEEALRIMQCESLGDPDAYNPYSGASGLYQFLPLTWATAAPKAGFPDASPFDPEANIGTAAWLAARYESLGLDYWGAWSCRRVLD